MQSLYKIVNLYDFTIVKCRVLRIPKLCCDLMKNLPVTADLLAKSLDLGHDITWIGTKYMSLDT